MIVLCMEIFERFRLKASKCKFGYSELDFVGKVISEEGPQMSSTRKQSALDFPASIFNKQLKTFLENCKLLNTKSVFFSTFITCTNS